MLALLDFDELHDLLLDATRDLLIHLQREYHDRQFYAFYLLHDPLWGFVVPKISVEDGIKPLTPLKRMSHMLIDRTLVFSRRPPKVPNMVHVLVVDHDVDGIKFEWKTFPAVDLRVASSIGREYFESVNMWLLRAQFHRVTFTYKQIEQYHRTLTSICIDVLQALDKRGLFGEGEARQQTLVNLVMLKDSDRDYLRHSKDLNPPEVYQRWIEELEGYRS